MNQSDYAHNSNFTETNERTPSNVPSYASLVIRRRNNRRIRHERHGIIIDTIRQALIHIEYIILLTKKVTIEK
ncbi:unnamed protein product [Rhizophagus irregularis]|nr:unnamed protein product [Rhizophagus irregularis]